MLGHGKSVPETKLPTLGHWMEAGCQDVKGIASVVPRARVPFGRSSLLKINAGPIGSLFAKHVLTLDKLGARRCFDLEIGPAVLIQHPDRANLRDALQILLQVVLGDVACYRSGLHPITETKKPVTASAEPEAQGSLFAQ